MKRRGFTLIELLVVIGIIALLMAILLPVVGTIQRKASVVRTQNQMSVISSAMMSYFHDFNAYPGPVANIYLAGGTKAGMDPIRIAGPKGPTKPITSSENLVLGLLGLLTPPTTAGGPIVYTPPGTVPPITSPHDVLSLNYLNPKSYHYIDYIQSQLSPGLCASMDSMAGANAGGNKGTNDSEIPEFIDSIGNPMPILYLRAQPGAPTVTNKLVAGGMSSGGNPDSDWQYNYDELAAYGCNVVDSNNNAKWCNFDDTLFTRMAAGVSSDISNPYPNMARIAPSPQGYLANPNISNAPRGANSFILISAGEDRTYGTADDIIVTP